MPTMRPRYQVTETDELARAIDNAGLRWPGESRAQLVRRLLDAGREALEAEGQTRDATHRAAVLASSGAYPDAFGSGYLSDLREDWPA